MPLSFWGNLMNYDALCQQVIAVAHEAGALLQEHASRPRDIQFKGRIDLVTATDLALESLLKQRLAELLPGSLFLAEESSPTTALEGYTWIIDPLDGTTNFAHGLPFVASSIALWHDGEIVLGVVNAPLIQECFSAVKGMGAYRNSKPIHVSATARLDHSLIATGFPYSFESEMDGLLRRMRNVLSACRGVRRYGAAAIDLAYVAAGHYDGFYERCLKPWDVAAGWLLITEAGGRFTRMTGEPFRIGDHDILATNGVIHDALHQLL